MCGIFGYIGSKNTAPSIVLEGLKKLEYRGYDSWGIAVIPEGEKKQTIHVEKRTGKIGDASIRHLPKGTLAFGHTRWATHGGVTDINAHPHLDCTKTLSVIHNGIVENYEQLKASLLKKGHRFVSGTDTEVIVHLVEEYLKRFSVLPRDAGPAFSKAVQAAFNDLEGLNAIILINSKANTIIAARNGSPLVLGFGDGENYLASDPSALLTHTKQVHYLEDDEMAVVTASSIHIFDVHSGVRIRPRKQMLQWSETEAEKGDYPFFMLKEIYEQPGMLSEIAAESSDQSVALAAELQQATQYYILGSGTSGNASRAASYFFAMIANRLTNWGTPPDMHHYLHLIPRKSIMIALSQSGETMDLLEVIKKAKKNNINVLSLVNVVESSLWRISDMKLPIGAGIEKGVASTKTYTATLAHLLLIAHAMNKTIKEGQLLIAKAAKATQTLFSDERIKQLQQLAKDLKNADHIFVVGRGLSYSTALESALKIKEISYIHAEGISAGELKHGPLALITKGLPCIVFAPNDEEYASTISNAMEMKARGGYIIGVSHKPDIAFDEFIPIPDVGMATIIPNVVASQLLAYYLTIERGFDPDKPRNLAKSVTVK